MTAIGSEGRRNYLLLSAFLFLFFFAQADAMSLLAIWLKGPIGLNGVQAGTVFSANFIAAMLCQPVYGVLSDRFGLRRYIPIFIASLVVLCGAFFTFVYAPLLQVNLILGAAIGGLYLGLTFIAGSFALESYVDRVGRRYGFEYSRARLWGSLGFASAAFFSGRLYNIDPRINFFIASAAGLLLIPVILAAKIGPDTAREGQAPDLPAGQSLSVLRQRKFWGFMVLILGVTNLYLVYDQQFPFYFASMFPTPAEGNVMFGYLNSAQIFVEAGMLAVAPFIVMRTGAKNGLMLAAGIMIVRIGGSALAAGPLTISACKMLHSIELPILAVSIFRYIAYHFDSRFASTVYDQGPLKVQVGGYYFKEHSDIESLFIGLLAPNAGTPGYVFGYPQKTNSSSVAGFGQATLSLTDRLRVTGGIRYTHDEKSRVGATIRHANLNAPLVFPPDLLNDAARTFSKVTWKAGIDWDVAERTLLYGSVSTGYKAGGFNNGCSAGTPNCLSPVPDTALYYRPETLTAYEVGFKTRLLNNSVRLNGNYFHYDYNDLQLTQLANLCNGPCQVTTNAARATIDGVELESTLQISPRNRVDLSAAWLKARYASYEIAPGVNLAGRQLDRSPEWTASAGYTYTYPLANGGSIGAGVRSRLSDSYMILSPVLRAQFRQPSFTKTDLTITYTAPQNRWYLQGFVKNLENAVTLSSATVALFYPRLIGGSASFGDPRLIGVRGGLSF